MSRFRLIMLIIALPFCLSVSHGQGKLSALVFTDYAYNIQRDTALTNAVLGGAEGFHGFQFRRINLTYDAPVGEGFVTRVRLEADETALTSDGKVGLFVKDAYLAWKGVVGKHDLILGIQPTPAFEVSEGVWGYRSLEKTIMDLRGIVGSRDFGISLRGPIDPDGSVHYVVLAGNGSGNKPEGDKWKRFYARVGAKPMDGMDITVYGDLSSRPDILSPYTSGSVVNSVVTGGAFVGLTLAGKARIGVEGTLQSTMNGYDTGTELTARNRLGISVFGRWSASETIEIVGRYDFFDPNIHENAKKDTRGYVLGGISWSPSPNVAVIPNVLMETFEATTQRSIKSSLTGRLTVVWSVSQ